MSEVGSVSRRDAPTDLSPRQAVRRYLQGRRAELSDSTIHTYEYRFKLFVEWCEANNIKRISELSGWDVDSYKNARLGEDIRPSTLQNEMKTLRKFIEWLERIEAVEDGLSDKVPIPDIPRGEHTDETMLRPEDALSLIKYFRNSSEDRASRRHALLELLWYTGARAGGVCGLDIRDYYPEKNYVEFNHRPETDTPLKNGLDGERPVGFPDRVSQVIDEYIEQYRYDKYDDHGREPLFTTIRGRPETGTMRVWSYLATLPCLHTECPHGRNPETCEYTEYSHASKCPSSRSPHQLRTGSITWQRDLGFPPEIVAERVNSSIDIIDQYYDHATEHERMEERRRPYIDRMRFEQ